MEYDQLKAPTGYYRNLLKDQYPNVRIAFTHTPIIGCKKIDSEKIIELLEASEDIYASYYANGLKDGSMVTIIEVGSDKIYKPGELYFIS